MKWVRLFFEDLSHLVFPFYCVGCGSLLDYGEKSVCAGCVNHLPLTMYWSYSGNAVERLFWGKIRLEQACSFVFFSQGGTVQQMLHHLKYKNRPDVGSLVGRQFGKELINTPYHQVDLIVPVPLHTSRYKTRGYNQSDFIAEGLALELKKPVSTDSVMRIRANETQTHKGKYQRWLNVKELFHIAKPEVLVGKHILLVDDVVTTGSTLEACAAAVLQVPETKVSVVTLACPLPI